MSEITIPDYSKPNPLDEDERGELRDWFDTSGRWSERMTNLYRLVESIVSKRQRQAMALAWEQGWVAAGNHYDANDNPYGELESER